MLSNDVTYIPERISGIPHSFEGVIVAEEKLLMNFKNGGVLEFVADDTSLLDEGSIIAKVNATEVYNNQVQVNTRLKDIDDDLDKLYELQKDSIGPVNKIKKLELQKEALLANKKSAAYNVGKSKIVAPYHGYISNMFKNVGEMIRPSEPVFEYSSINKKVTFSVPDNVVGKLRMGQEIIVLCNVCNDQNETPAKISKVAFKPEMNGLYLIEASFEATSVIKEGFSINIALRLDNLKEFAILPLRFVDKIIEEGSIVSYTLKNGKAKQITIPFVRQYDHGFIIPSKYDNYEFIEALEHITDGIPVQKK